MGFTLGLERFTIFQPNHNQMNLFYRLWLEAIDREEKKRGKKSGKTYAFLFLTFCESLNLISLFIIAKILFSFSFSPFLSIDIFSGKLLDGLLSGFLTIVAPFMLLNYLIIFRGKKYQKLQESYQPKSSKLYFAYVGSSFLLFFLPIVLGFIMSRV